GRTDHSQGGRARIRNGELSQRDDEPRRAPVLRLNPRCAGPRRRFQPDDQPQGAAWLNSGMEVGDQPLSCGHTCTAREARVSEIDNLTVRALEAEALLRSRSAQD